MYKVVRFYIIFMSFVSILIFSIINTLSTQLVNINVLSLIITGVIILFISKTVTKIALDKYYKSLRCLSKYIKVATEDNDCPIDISDSLEEFKPIFEEFEDLLEGRTVYIKQARDKQKDIEKIINSMEEGLLLLDSNFKILLSNKKGLATFGIKRARKRKSFIHLYRNEKLINILKKMSITNKSNVIDIDNPNNEIYRIHISPVADGGFAILTTNVTHIINLEKVQKEFSANVSHQLKTPITSISGFAELINKGMVTDSNKINEYTYKIYTEAQRLIELIDDILKLSEIENVTVINKEKISIKEIIDNVVDILSQKIKEKNITLEIKGNASIFIKYSHLVELIMNLLDNAIKYNKQNGYIYITVSENDTHISISVKDTGIGIEEEEIKYIFERFYRVDKGSKVVGNGLGLSIVNHIVNLYDGNIKVNSSTEGSEFIILLKKPLCQWGKYNSNFWPIMK